MSEHLSDREMAQLLAGNGDPRPHVHVAECDACRAERDRLSAAMNEFRGDVQQATARDDFFWSRQRHSILSSLAERPTHRLRWAVSVLMAVAALSTALLVAPARHAPVALAPVANTNPSDEQLLLEVQADLDKTAPEALEPAEVLQQERATLMAQLEKKQERRNVR